MKQISQKRRQLQRKRNHKARKPVQSGINLTTKDRRSVYPGQRATVILRQSFSDIFTAPLWMLMNAPEHTCLKTVLRTRSSIDRW